MPHSPQSKHAQAIAALPAETRTLVLLALTVRAMDFIHAKIDDDSGSDEAADIVREFLPGEDEFWYAAHGRGFFNPDDWATTREVVRFAEEHDPYDVDAWTGFMEAM